MKLSIYLCNQDFLTCTVLLMLHRLLISLYIIWFRCLCVCLLLHGGIKFGMEFSHFTG